MCGRTSSLASTVSPTPALKFLTAAYISDRKVVLSMIRAVLLILSGLDIVAGPPVVTQSYHLAIEIAHGSELDFRTAVAGPSWYG